MSEELVLSTSGLEAKQENEIKNGLATIKKEREALMESFENVIQEEISEENIPMFKTLRLQIRDNRTKGIEDWHKTNKAFFLAGGRFVDSIKNKEVAVNKRMEDALKSCEDHFEIQEANKLKELQSEREGLISPFLFEGEEHREYCKMDDELWMAIFESKKKTHADHVEAEKKAEEERQAKAKAEEEERLAMVAENARLKAEAEAKAKQDKIEADERNRLAKIESDKRDKIEADRIKEQLKVKAIADMKLKTQQAANAKLAAELKAKKEAELSRIAKQKEAEAKEAKAKAEAKQLELKKGDEEKVNDLVRDLEALAGKYKFTSEKYIKIGLGVVELIKRTVTYIKK